MFSSGDLLRSVIKSHLSNVFVYPNKFTINIKKDSNLNAGTRISGGFHVLIELFDDLKKFEGLFATGSLQLGKQVIHLPEFEIKHGTSWLNFECHFVDFTVVKRLITILLEIETDDGSSVKITGNLDVEKILLDKETCKKYPLTPSGSVSASISRFTLTSSRKDLHFEKEKSCALLEVFVDSALKLLEDRKKIFVKLSIANQHQESSPTNKNSKSWRKTFFFFLKNPDAEILNVHVIDQETGEKFAKFSYKLSSLISRDSMEHKLQAFSFSSLQDCEVLMSLRLFAIQPKK